MFAERVSGLCSGLGTGAQVAEGATRTLLRVVHERPEVLEQLVN